MNYLSVEGLSKSYGEKILFENISFGIAKGQKTALIARNGTGKTTLLNILAGKEIADKGSVVFRKDIKIAYLSQNPQFERGATISYFIFDNTNEIVSTTTQYENILLELAKDDSKENHKQLETLIHKMDSLNAWNYESRVKEVLGRLELTDLNAKMCELSGGQQKKVALAKVLLEIADFLILDEPTNHLDIEMTVWLEEFLSKQNLSLLLVTHDRAFLDAICSEVIELDNTNLYTYKGNYSYFLEKKTERELIFRAEIEKAKNTYKRELDWMRRMPSARTTKSKARKDAFYEIKAKASQKVKEDMPDLSVKSERMGGKILEIYNLSKSFGDKKLIDDFSYTFKRGEKIGIVGANGSGKSTFLRILTGELKFDSGKVIVGQTIKFGYYKQDGFIGGEDKRVIDIIKEVAEVVKLENGMEISASQFLTYFQFEPTTQYNYFSNLSGGEKRRLYLLRTLMANPNFLILDEPTNDLDVFTLMLLEDFLANYKGCLLIVSHDRSFMDNLVDHIFVFEGEGKIKDYYDTYSEYKKKKAQEKKIEVLQQKETTQKASWETKERKPKLSFKEKRELELLEEKIPILEHRKLKLEDILSCSDGMASEELLKASTEIAFVIDELNICELRWLELSELM